MDFGQQWDTPGSDLFGLCLCSGWNLGEGNLWCKMTNTENGARTPFIIRAPGIQPAGGARTTHLAEAIDMYRTMADATGLLDAVQPDVDGVSLLPVIRSPATTAPPRTASQSQFPRCYSVLPPSVPGGRNAPCLGCNWEHLPPMDRTDCQDVARENFDLMGYSIRTADFRLTEWRAWDGAKLEGRWDLPPNATELYDHTTASADVFASELTNIAAEPSMSAVLAKMRALLRERFAPHTLEEAASVRLKTDEAAGATSRTPQTLLLVDDDDVIVRPQTERVLNPLTRSAGEAGLRGVIQSTLTWESGMAYNSVHYAGPAERAATGAPAYTLWYQCCPPGTGGTDPVQGQAAPNDGGCVVCLAESSNGLTWSKPKLGLHPAIAGNGSVIAPASETNIVLGSPPAQDGRPGYQQTHYGASVYVEPWVESDQPDPRRFKMVRSLPPSASRALGLRMILAPTGVLGSPRRIRRAQVHGPLRHLCRVQSRWAQLDPLLHGATSDHGPVAVVRNRVAVRGSGGGWIGTARQFNRLAIALRSRRRRRHLPRSYAGGLCRAGQDERCRPGRAHGLETRGRAL